MQQFPASHRYEPTDVGSDTSLGIDLNDRSIRTIIWATGYRPDYSWLDVPVLDRKGRIRHDGGVVAAPGMYVLGLPFMAINFRHRRFLGEPATTSLNKNPASFNKSAISTLSN